MFLCDGFWKTDLDIDLIANAFRGSHKSEDYFRYFLHLFSVPSFIFLEGAYSCLSSKDGFTYGRLYSVQNASCSFTCI